MADVAGKAAIKHFVLHKEVDDATRVILHIRSAHTHTPTVL